jgi:hypothetical protein
MAMETSAGRAAEAYLPMPDETFKPWTARDFALLADEFGQAASELEEVAAKARRAQAELMAAAERRA